MISAIVLTKNEEANIESCLEKLKWCDEIIVIDDNSTDRTASIAAKIGAKVIFHPLNNDFSATRNYALDQAHEKWVLYVDADEHVSFELQKEILKAINDISIKSFQLKRLDYFFGKQLKFGDTGNTKLIRLVRRGSGEWVGKVHETWKTGGKVGELKNPLKHYPHKSIVEFLRHINFYSSLRALELKSNNSTSSVTEIICYPIGKFLYLYIFTLGFLDGARGAIHAFMMSFYSFLVRAKLYLLWKNISGFRSS